MKEQLLATWDANHRMHLLLINNITDAGMQKTLSTRGGRTILQQWIHIHNVRMQWLEVSAKDIFLKHTVMNKDMTIDRKVLLNGLEESFTAIWSLLSRSWDDGGKVKGFKKGIIPFLGYFISHESHHRSNMILTLKQSGEKIPDSAKWELWEWGK